MKKVILLINLGSPEKCDVTSIRQFLQEFLSDKRVVGLPNFIWYPILHGIILPFRAKKLLHKYEQIWLKNGESPLNYYTKVQAAELNKLLPEIDVYSCFSYAKNNIAKALTDISKKYANNYELEILPLYPQYSSSTSASVFDFVARFYANAYFIPSMTYKNGFADNLDYIKLLADKVRTQWQVSGTKNKLIVSFHSIPQKLIDSGDSYQLECEKTFKLLCQELLLEEDDAILCYQSKFGRAKWLEPSTETMIKKIAYQKCKNIDVICPGFVSDCLETLEEIKIQYAELFIKNGGEQLNYISCFNDDVRFARVLQNLIER